MFDPDSHTISDHIRPIAATGPEFKKVSGASRLLAQSSIELSTNGREAIRQAAAILPSGMAVYVPRLPTQRLEEKLVQIRTLFEFGLRPVPHIAARKITSRQELQSFLEFAVNEANVRRVLVIGGDDTKASGPFPDSASLIASGILKSVGIEEIDVAGYPERHPRIPAEILAGDLERKVKMARQQNLEINVVTQFSFNPEHIIAYCNELAARVGGVPVYAGLAGPTSVTKLIRFARICGVGHSLKAANSLGINAVRLAGHSSPHKHFSILAAGLVKGTAGNLAGIHLFSFGGFVESADWLSKAARKYRPVR
jgi:methylenetetrahydrofolate reductase (NADPH)